VADEQDRGGGAQDSGGGRSSGLKARLALLGAALLGISLGYFAESLGSLLIPALILAAVAVAAGAEALRRSAG
jgi:hypothetical protein